ncbi:hypothetical protein DSM106972_016790 [Dulcicalothrix desertica PCC 7102]|uniref:Uncharacterized protein n=1 Tax=Dulcicalothrix desertica PCC 7102 TaxID=232991 RepID=A0A433VR30_9CYAN|nr:hypothetical protein [Dulcicalothrix desertica]RUT08511.1 hypothetical protein DSM106972_016790 [Dulcicalothrix desertica PCC 7102]TWH40369.1 hypothetical protein CAL7102_09690 [Dulcicalothrix desertica PCC 7102]
MNKYVSVLVFLCLCINPKPAYSQTPSPGAQDLDLSPEIINNSPVLQRWRRKVPNVLEDIKNDPSFRSRLRFGYFPTVGVKVGAEDIQIDKTRFTISGEYYTTFNGKHTNYGGDINYYLRPLGSYVNVAPVLGYRHISTEKDSTNGVNVGAKLLLVLSRGGGGDISLTQTWVAPASNEEIGLTKLSVGYAITRKLRISTDIEQQNGRQKESRAGIILEWMLIP